MALASWSADELLTMEFPELDWVVPEYIPEGFTVLGGRPKIGKSWLAMQIAQAVGMGGKVFGHDVKQGHVLYLALEDNPRRLARRMKAQHWEEGTHCQFYNEWTPLNEGGLEELAELFGKVQYRLCVIDTASRALRLKDVNDNASVTKAYDAVQKFFESRKCSVLLLDHHNKRAGMEESDPIDAIIASTAKVAVPDTIVGVARQRGKRDVRIRIVGRDAEDVDSEIQFDSLTMSWQMLDTKYIKPGSVQNKIFDYVKAANGYVPLSMIAEFTQTHKGQALKELQELVVKGLVEETKMSGQNFYALKSYQS